MGLPSRDGSKSLLGFPTETSVSHIVRFCCSRRQRIWQPGYVPAEISQVLDRQVLRNGIIANWLFGGSGPHSVKTYQDLAAITRQLGSHRAIFVEPITKGLTGSGCYALGGAIMSWRPRNEFYSPAIECSDAY
jgi:hypothetical protein